VADFEQEEQEEQEEQQAAARFGHRGIGNSNSLQQKQQLPQPASCSSICSEKTGIDDQHAEGIVGHSRCSCSGQSNGRQLQQQQPKEQVQKGAAGVAWYLAADAIQAAQAWNSSIGRFDKNSEALWSCCCAAPLALLVAEIELSWRDDKQLFLDCSLLLVKNLQHALVAPGR